MISAKKITALDFTKCHASCFQAASVPKALAFGAMLVLLSQANAMGQLGFNVPAPHPLSDTFLLESLPGANHTIYLDFDGHDCCEGPYPAYDFEGGAGTFTANEKKEIQLAWQSVAEDFLPFEINITTKFPGIEALRKTGPGDTQWGIRAVVSPSPWNYSWAYNGSFNDNSDSELYAWSPDDVTDPDERGTDWLWVADSISHEAGHALGLADDGTAGSGGYYHGHGSGATHWTPIMGWSNFGPSHWDNGEYPNANHPEQDDLAIITSGNGFGYRTDDHGSDTGSATPISDGVLIEGIIERNDDFDYFSFTMSSAGNVSFDINPNAVGRDHWYGTGTVGANLDILAEIRDSGGNVIHTSNPVDLLTASFTDIPLAAGNYYLSIDGTGKGDFPTGYSDYGSLGYFSITGSGWGDLSIPGDFNGDGIVDGADFLKWQRDDGTSASLAEWEANFGTVDVSVAASAAVPEPSSFALIVAGLIGMGYRHRKQAASDYCLVGRFVMELMEYR